MDDIELTEEDIAFIIDQMHFALIVSERSFSKRVTTQMGKNPQDDQQRIKKFKEYKSRVEYILTKLRGDKNAEASQVESSTSPGSGEATQKPGRQGPGQSPGPRLGRPRK